MKPFVDTENPKARPTGEYAKVINSIAKDGVCPFCPDHLTKYHKLPLVHKKFWTVTDNMYPYKPNKHHKLLIHREHITHMNEISPEAFVELNEIVRHESAKGEFSGGTFIMRFGETKYTGASVTHIHAHLIQSDPDDPSYDKAKGLMMRIG